MAVMSILLGGLVTWFVGWIIYCRWLHPYSKYPGPFLASFSRLWIIKELYSGHLEVTLKKWHAKHGELSALSFDLLISRHGIS